MADVSIKLAGNSYTIAPLTLGQLRDLSIGVVLPDTTDPQEIIRRSFERAVGTIAIALRANNPELTLEKLYEMPITREEMRAASEAVLVYSGLVAPSETAQGEKAGTA